MSTQVWVRSVDSAEQGVVAEQEGVTDGVYKALSQALTHILIHTPDGTNRPLHHR